MESQSQSHAATQVPPPLSSANEWLSKSRIKDIEPAMKYWEWFTRSPALVGQSIYNGETKRALETHLKEHQAATRRGETEKSAIIEHAWSRHHQPLWEETRTLNRASHTTTLLIKETIHISLRHPAELLNRDQGLDSDYCWKNLARRPPKRQQDVFLLTCVDVLTIYLARSLNDLLSVYSDEGHSIVVEMSVKDLL